MCVCALGLVVYVPLSGLFGIYLYLLVICVSQGCASVSPYICSYCVRFHLFVCECKSVWGGLYFCVRLCVLVLSVLGVFVCVSIVVC